MDALRDLIQKEDPTFYDYLLHRELPPGWSPDPDKVQQILGLMTRDECRACRNPQTSKICSACKVARYCNPECQRLDWETHKAVCTWDRSIREGLKEQIHSGHPD
jgi:hypothetical protein